MQDFKDFIEQVKRANDIVDVIGGYIELKQRGQNHWARCPFHGEKTPSFAVSKKSQTYKCYGCGEAGDVLKFVEKFESVDFWTALETLANRAGIKMPERSKDKTDVELEAKKKKRDVYMEILKETARFYYRNLRCPRGKIAQDYLAKRGISQKTQNTFGIGLSLDTDGLTKHLQNKGFSIQDAVAVGVLQQSQKSNRVFDALFNRLIVPVFNANGQVVAFGGRALTKEQEQFGKYNNTAESPVFSKQNVLYGENFTRQAKKEGLLKHLLIVEGYMDVIALHQSGFPTCVASMGTSLTEKQAQSLSRLNNNVYICYDGDGAGQKATIRGLDILKTAGLDVFVVSLPDKLDPDEYVRKYGVEKFEQLIQNSLPLIDYKIKLLDEAFRGATDDERLQNTNRVKYVNGAIKLLKDMTEDEKYAYVDVLARKSGFTKDYLLEHAKNNQKVEQNENETTSIYQQALTFVARALLHNCNFAKLDQKPQGLQSLFMSKVYDYIFQCQQKGETPRADSVFNPDWGGDKEAKLLLEEFDVESQSVDKQYFDECVKIIKAQPLIVQREQLRTSVKSGLEGQELTKALQQIELLTLEIDSINN